MSQKMSRKEFFKKGIQYSVGVTAGAMGLQALTGNTVQGKTSYTWPCPYSQLDPEVVRISGHDAFYSGKGCSYGAFHAIIQALRTAVGTPYTEIPTELMIYGHGGGVGWGTLCGAINGAAGAMCLVLDKATADQLIHELIGWYTQTPFPTDISNDYGVNSKYTVNKYTQTLAQNESNSPLCHVSVSKWCKVAGFKVNDAERKERCGRLTGDVAAKAVEILNDHFNGKFQAGYVPPESIASCMLCHGKTIKDNVASQMECKSCHGDPHAPSLIDQMNGELDQYELSKNFPNPFNPSTSIEFSMPKAEPVTLSIYDLNGRLVSTLINNQTYLPGKHRIQWDGCDQTGNTVPSGMYFYRFMAGKFRKSESMMMVK
jgi:hypothetical protein